MKKRFSMLLAALLLLALLSGCGSSAYGKTSTPAAAPSMASSGAKNDSAGWTADVYTGEIAEASKSASPAVQQQSGSGLPANVKLIYRANIDMESTEFDAALQGLNELVARLGGYFENSELNNYARYRYGSYVVRVPAENFEAFCSAVGELCQVNNLSRSAEDVSEYYYDTESRLATQKTKLARLQELLKQAEDMEDIITLESAISDTELTIENLTGTLRKYDSLVGYATVRISLQEVYQLTETEEPAIGFGAKMAAAFRSGSSRFVSGIQSFLLSVARGWIGWLVFIVFVLAVVWIVFRIRRRRRARAAQKQQPQPAPRKPEE